MRKNLAVALVGFASVLENDLVHLDELVCKFAFAYGPVFANILCICIFCLVRVSCFVFRRDAWSGEQSASNHDAGEFRVAFFHFADLRNACDVSVINERMATFAIKFFKRFKINCALVLLLAEHRTEFAADLKKMLPRIPLVDTADDFWAFSNAGRKLADIHLNYEQAEPYRCLIVSSKSTSADLPLFGIAAGENRAFFSAEAPETLYKVRQMRFAKKQVKAANGKMKTEDDKTRIVYNDKITVAKIPLEVYEYVVNGKSAISQSRYRRSVQTKH